MPKSDVTVIPSWNAVLVDDGDGVLYVNMPETGTKTVDIPENVVSFKVYDDGGKDENHSLHAAGYLVLNAPEGYQLQVTGTARYSYAYFFIYDGDSEAKKLFDEEYATNGIDVGTIRSSGNKLTVYFKSRSANASSNYSGLDLTVSLVKVDFGAVSIAKASDGKIKIDENSSEYPRAKAMRCYLRKRDANVKLQQQNQAQMVAASPYVARYSINNLPETIDVEFVKDDAKGGRTVLHGRMNTVTGEFKMLRDYDLKGRKVNSTNRARGAYYGKKVMKK